MSLWKTWSGNSNIVSLMPRGNTAPGASQLRQIEAYWQAVRGERDIPLRSEIDPRGLENVLEYAFILERIAPGVARFRIAGQHLAQLAGMEVRGMPLSALFAGQSRARMGAILEKVFDVPAVAELQLTSSRDMRTAHPSGRMMLMPLRSDLGEVNRALGAIYVDCQSPTHPKRLNLTEVTFRTVDAPGLRQTALSPEPQAHAFAEEQRPLTGRRPHLRIVKSD